MVRVKLVIFLAMVLQVLCNDPLPSNFYQPTSGVYFERWLSTTYYSMAQFNSIPNYPDCPTFISHSDKFECTDAYSGKHQYGRFRASFVSTQTGIHKFFAILNNKAQVYIELNPTGSKKILDVGSATSNNWSNKKWCDDVNLMKGFRYEITVYYYGNGQGPEFFKLGVKFPDNTEVKPITNTYLRRSMEYYNWKGLLAHKYDNFQFPSSQGDYTLQKAYSMNPAYPSNPVAYLCKSTLYDPPGHQFEYYAVKYIGYMSVPETAHYRFKMNCNEICQLNMTKSGSETVLGHYSDAYVPSPTNMDGGTLSKDTLYPIKVFFCESWGNDYIQISYQKGSGSYLSSWSGMLRNLLPAETAKSLPLPVPAMVNSTTISIQLPSAPYLPPKDTWTYVQNHEVLYHRSGVQEAAQKLTVSGALPQTTVATGLQKYTDYVFYAHYFGTINGKDQNIITGYSVVMKTDEDVPDSAPPNVILEKKSSTSIKVKWGSISSLSIWNGIPAGYEVQFRLKDAGSYSWTSVVISERQYTTTGLLKYRIYEFKVAARTSKGSGVFSSIKEERTMEDTPTSAPSNITATNTSSSSISVSWGDVPAEHQNGIITGYKVYIRKEGSSGTWSVDDTSNKQLSKSGLDLWTIYDVKISAKTSIGEGVKSTIVKVRTDEDVPGAGPTSISAVALSSTTVNVTWSEIIANKRYGIIISYKVKYKRTDGIGVESEVAVNEKSAILEGLDKSIEYDITVAGITIKGVGVYSSKITITTSEDVPDGPPENLRGNFTNATAIRLHWDLVREEDRNGIITGYAVQYKIKDSQSAWQEVVIGANLLTLNVTNLEYYTIYQFKIAAETRIGRGPFSNLTYIRTDAYGPSKPPMNLTGHFLDQQSIKMTWSRVPLENRQGVIDGYKLYYKDKTIPDVPWSIITVPNRQGGDDMFNQTITGLKIYTPYIFKISAFTYRVEGVIGDNVTVWTDEYEPKEPPRNISGVNASSTEIILRWKDMKEIDGEANGQVLGYTVTYRVIDCHEDRPEGCDENEVFNITTNGSTPEIKIPNLRKYTMYSLSVQVFNSKGRGNFSTKINITTDEDVPDEPPTTVETWPLQSHSIKIYWSPIPESYRNGIILGYRIFYKAIDEALRRYDRAPRSVNQFAIYGALPGEKMVEVNSSDYSVELKSLKDYSWYQVRIGAFTSKGLGTTFTINGTTKQGSPMKAPDLEVIDMYDFERILLKWKPISPFEAKGEVLGYRIQYFLSELHEAPILGTKGQIIDVLEPNRTVVISGLQAFASYRIRILAFTEGGFGIWSHMYVGETCRCPKVLSSAKIILPPLVHGNNSEILPALIDEAITSCCGNCSGKHGVTHVNWDRDAKNSSSVKYSKQEALDAIVAGTNLALPIFRDSFEIEGDVDKSEYIMVPLLESKYVVIFKKGPTKREMANEAASIILCSLFMQYPLIVISTVLTILAAILFWFFECGINRAEFSNSYIRGSGSGLWLAYITMTTVGYGDITPKTKLGKILAMIWMLIGLALISMITGNLSSIFSMEFIVSPHTIDSTGKVLTSEETLMIATQIYGGNIRIGNTTDGKYVQQSLISGNVSRVLLDVYSAGSLKDYLIHPKIILEKTETIVGSYGLALAGDAKRIHKCVNRQVRENSKSTAEKIQQHEFFFKLGDVRSTDLIQHMISSHSDITKDLTFYGGILLAILIVIGAIYEARKYYRERAKVETDASIREGLSDEILEDINSLESSIISKLERIENSHINERQMLSKLQYARYEKLAAMYPSLHLFDPEMPKMKKKTEDRYRNITEGDFKQTYECSSSDDDENMSIDYRMDNY